MRSAYIPNQHGAWAMLLVPFVLGVAAAGPVWLHAPLFLFWLSAYLFSFAFLQGVRTKRWDRTVRPMLLYGSVLAAASLLLVIMKPSLLLWAPVFVPLFLVNIGYARRNRERAFANDLAAVVQFHLIIFIALAVADSGNWTMARTLFALSLLYFTGTIFYVKTVIREKNNPRYYAMSVLYHAMLPVVAGAVFRTWEAAAVFLLMFVRAAWVPRAGLQVKTVGVLEMALAVLFVAATLLWMA